MLYALVVDFDPLIVDAWAETLHLVGLVPVWVGQVPDRRGILGDVSMSIAAPAGLFYEFAFASPAGTAHEKVDHAMASFAAITAEAPGVYRRASLLALSRAFVERGRVQPPCSHAHAIQ